MSFNHFINKFRQIDNTVARWVMRHFYFMFFQVILVVIFIAWMSNAFKVIDMNFQADKENILQQILMTQSINTTIIVILLLLNSFWLLYIFSGIQRLRSLLRDISYHLSKQRNK